MVISASCVFKTCTIVVDMILNGKGSLKVVVPMGTVKFFPFFYRSIQCSCRFEKKLCVFNIYLLVYLMVFLYN